MSWQKLYVMDVLEGLKLIEDESIDMVMTSPPYWGLRDYGVKGQLGLEDHPQKFIAKIVEIFAVIEKKLKSTGSVYLNLGDTYYSTGGINNTETQSENEWKRPSRDAYSQAFIGKNCILCGKKRMRRWRPAEYRFECRLTSKR